MTERNWAALSDAAGVLESGYSAPSPRTGALTPALRAFRYDPCRALSRLAGCWSSRSSGLTMAADRLLDTWV